jgi:hypothetical protein
MAVQVEGKTLTRRPRYPWGMVMDGQYWELKRGTDFEDLERCRIAALMYANRHKPKLIISTTKVDDDTLGIEVLGTL